jgi:uncharacterized protein YjbI with pentapeptide repeats
MRAETVRTEDLSKVEWDDSYFKYCEFLDFSLEGDIACSDFVSCTFHNIDWYWGFFASANFIRCRFIDCDFRGCNFADARFVDCELTRCHFVNDNLGGACKFDEAAAYGCTLIDTTGFTIPR